MTVKMSEALKEAYASAPADVVTLNTISLYHPSWIDEDGKAVTLYFVQDHADHEFMIEDTAERGAGQSVLFIGTAFEFTLPEQKTSSVPEVTITIDNVSGEIIQYLDRAAKTSDKVLITYRAYLSNDPSTPQNLPPLELTLSTIKVSAYKITGTARSADLGRKRFPRNNYSIKDFPALANFT